MGQCLRALLPDNFPLADPRGLRRDLPTSIDFSKNTVIMRLDYFKSLFIKHDATITLYG